AARPPRHVRLLPSGSRPTDLSASRRRRTENASGGDPGTQIDLRLARRGDDQRVACAVDAWRGGQARDHARNAQRGLRTELQHLGMSFVPRLRELGDAVEQRLLFRVVLAVALAHEPPAVPGEELSLASRAEIAHQVPAHEPQAAQVEDAEALRILRSAAAALPRVARHQELRARDVEWVERNPEQLALYGIELRVDEPPRPRALVPDPADPVAREARRLEVSPEAAAGARRHAAGPQEGAEENGEVPAVADEAPRRRTRRRQRAGIEGQHAVEHLRRAPGLQ